MEYFLLVAVLIVLLVINSRWSRSSTLLNVLAETIGRLALDISELKKEIGSLKNDIAGRPIGTPPPVVADYSGLTPDQPVQVAPPVAPVVAAPEPVPQVAPATPDQTQETVLPPAPEPAPAQPMVPEPVAENAGVPAPEAIETNNETAEPIFETPAEQVIPVAAFTEPAPKGSETAGGSAGNKATDPGNFQARSGTDVEKFIGENLINKIGIAILVLGIAFFVKYAIDQNWINEAGRVAIGLLCGAILIGVAHYLRKGYRSFSSVLAGGGVAVFYATIAFAFHQYQLLSQTAAFGSMVVITAFAVALSVLYDRLELAVIAAIGGFITPFLVSHGDGNYIALFTYLVILNGGLLALAYFKRWPALNVISLLFTLIIYGGWLTVTISGNKPFSPQTAFAFATVFYLIFLGMNMVHQVRKQQRFVAFDFFILLLINGSYFAAGMITLHLVAAGAYEGLFTLSQGVVNLGLAYYIYRRSDADRNLLFLLIGLTLTFITLTIPIQLHGHAITMFWSAEFVLLYWLALYSGIRIFRYSSMIICGLSVISLIMDWTQTETASPGAILIIYANAKGLVTNLVSSAAFAAYYLLLRRSGETEFLSGVSATFVRRFALFSSILLLYITCIFGVNLNFIHETSYEVPNVYHRLITELFALAVIIAAQRVKELPKWLPMPAYMLCFVCYIFSADLITNLRDHTLSGMHSSVHLSIHWAVSALLALLFYMGIRAIRINSRELKDYQKPAAIITSIMIIVFITIECMHVYVVAAYRDGNALALESQYARAGIDVVLALCSFTMMWLGMKHGRKELRVFSLVIFGIILAKLFMIDIADISEGGKILAFIFLGVLLLIISFMYQKLKSLIIDDKEKQE